MVYLATFAVYYSRIEADEITVSLDYELFGLNYDKGTLWYSNNKGFGSVPNLDAAFLI